MKPRASNPFRPHLFTFAALLAAPFAHAAPVIWGPATTISADTNVLNVGATNYAYNFSNVNQTVNGILFTGTNIGTGAIGSNVTMGSSWTNNTSAFQSSPAAGTWNGLSAAYKGMLQGGDYSDGTTARTVTLQSLTSGRVYATQIWVNDSRGGNRTETVTSTGGNTVTLDFNSTDANGGVGQYTTGRFVADAATQVFSLQGLSASPSAQINAFQVREVTNIGNWVGTGGATWDAATTNNFASNLFSAALTTTNFGAAKAPLNSVTFADSYWNSGVATAVTQTAVTVDAAGVSTGTVYFDNSAVNYTLGNASGTIGITGATAIVKNGSGTVTLNGANTYTGTTTITGGTLQYNSNDNQTLSGAIAGSGTLSKSGGGTLTLTAANNSHTGSTPISGGILRIGGAGRLNSGNYAGAISFTNGSTLQYSSSNIQTLAGAITGAGGITKDGNTSDLTLSNAGNNYTGTTTVSNGRIVVSAATHLSSGATSIVQSGTGQVFAQNAVTYTNPFNISGTGYVEPGDSQNNINGAIRMSGGTLSGQITLSGNSRIGALGTATNTISGKITGGFGIDFYGFQQVLNTAPVFVLSNTGNDYTGATTIYNSNYNTTNLAGVSTTLRLGASNVIPHGASAGNVAFAINGTNNNATVILDLNGFNETINGLTVNAGTFATRITNTAAAANSVLTLGANDTTSSFSGTITDSGAGRTLAITKTGTGNLTLSGTNNYIGGTTIDGGALTLGHATDTLANGGAVNVNGGTLALGTTVFSFD